METQTQIEKISVVEETPSVKEISRAEKISLSTTEIAEMIKGELKKEFSNCVFSVSSKYFSGGSEVNVCLMKSGLKVVKPFEELTELDLLKVARSAEQIKAGQAERYHQLNAYGFNNDYGDLNGWNNGVFLTLAGWNLLKRVCEIQNKYNFDESEPQADYFSVNFWFHLSLGKWNKPLYETA